jgi:hypothetical protein
MSVMRLALILCWLSFACGCANVEANRAHQQALRLAAVEGQCRSYGFTPDTPGFANCMMQTDQAQQAQAQAARSASSAALIQSGLMMMEASQPRVLPTRMPVQTRCTDWRNGQFSCISQ